MKGRGRLTVMATMAAMMAAIGGDNSFVHERMGVVGNVETDEEKERRKKYAQSMLNRAKGLSEFYYSGSSEPIWAINQRVADKKAKKLGLL